MALLIITFGLLALLAPLGHEEILGGRVGVLLVLTAIVEFAHGFRRAEAKAQRSAWVSSLITLVMGLLLANSPLIASNALLILIAAWFGLDAIRHVGHLLRRRERDMGFTYTVAAALGNAAVCIGLILFRLQALEWTVALAAALRIFGTAVRLMVTPVYTAEHSGWTVIQDIRLPEDEELNQLGQEIDRSESSRLAVDRGWILGFILTLFAIHLGRMGLDRTALRIVSPAFAVMGDLFIGLLLAFVVIIPLWVLWLRLTRGLDRYGWKWVLAQPENERHWRRRLVQTILTRRLRSAIRLRQARYSFTRALSRALQIGLPLAAITAATFPVWGMSWYFDTENWAAGIWNSWAASRTDTWREAMVKAVIEQDPLHDPTQAFAVKPEGVGPSNDFSFIVIGDPGEGDASQLVLHAQFLDVVRRPDMKFVIISSDVIYPTGAMRDAEARFFMPFFGTTKPIYAIPGNHDWYDALEGFTALFLEPRAARVALRARIEADKRITSTTESYIEQLIQQSSRLQREYRLTVQQQKAPFFQLQTDSFALFAVDTGVVKRVDPVQWEWFKRGLESARGKTKMAILGHPLYAGGAYLAEDVADFRAIHDLLREHNVHVVMAGDTHDLEYYAEKLAGSGAVMHHFVNGGGGAYLSFGTSLAWPDKTPTSEWAFYPAKEKVVSKIEASTPRWKWPAWWWTKHMGGWPFSAEFLSAAFDVNVAPYYQSFMEVRVEPSKRRLVLIPYGIHGRLHWRDLDCSPTTIPPGQTADSLVEWVIGMKP
jgi:uncharacterized membrane protein HdeD (DUF308 family)